MAAKIKKINLLTKLKMIRCRGNIFSLPFVELFFFSVIKKTIFAAKIVKALCL